MKNILIKSGVVVLITIAMLFAFEGILRIYNMLGKNYDIEMWKYGKYLKTRSSNPEIGFEHVPSKSYRLQNIDISINSSGFRGADVSLKKPAGTYRIMVLGSSITFGWGVPEETTFPRLIEKWLEGKTGEKKVEVINAAVGNYNTVREVAAFFEKGAAFDPDMVILTFFINDPQMLDISKSNFFLQHSQLAVMVWSTYNQLIRRAGIKEDYAAYYRRLYSDENPGWVECQKSLTKLMNYCREKKIVVIMALIPEIHDLQNYKFMNVNEMMKNKAAEMNFQFIDFYDVLKNVNAPDIWAMRGDPHPNIKGHDIMARYLYDRLMHDKPWEQKSR